MKLSICSQTTGRSHGLYPSNCCFVFPPPSPICLVPLNVWTSPTLLFSTGQLLPELGLHLVVCSCWDGCLYWHRRGRAVCSVKGEAWERFYCWCRCHLLLVGSIEPSKNFLWTRTFDQREANFASCLIYPALNLPLVGLERKLWICLLALWILLQLRACNYNLAHGAVSKVLWRGYC